MNSKRVAAYLTICEDDAWLVPQWIAEVERLQIDFAVHFDRCSVETKKLFTYHPDCTGYTSQDDPNKEYTEHDKQRSFDMLVLNRYDWGLQLDADETLEKNGPVLLRQTIDEYEKKETDYIGLRYVSLWNDKEHIRVDGPFAKGYHVKLYNLTNGRRWKFAEPTVNGAYLMKPDGKKQANERVKGGKCDLVCLNHGAMTHELRLKHKERWDRIYTHAVGSQIYGFWNYSLDYEKFPPVVHPNPYL